MKKGYTKAWRKEIESDIWKMPCLYHRVFYWLRQKVKFRTEFFPTTQKLGIWLLPAQLLTSYEEIAKGVSWVEYGIERKPNKKTIKTVLNWLKEQKMIQIESNKHGTIIFIVNWHTYQPTDNEKVTLKKRQLDTIKEYKELKEEKDSCKQIKSYNLASLLGKHILLRRPTYKDLLKEKKEKTLLGWSIDIDRLIRIDNADPLEVEKVINWCQEDKFWQNNILSGAKLRKQYNQLAMKMPKETVTPQYEERDMIKVIEGKQD